MFLQCQRNTKQKTCFRVFVFRGAVEIPVESFSCLVLFCFVFVGDKSPCFVRCDVVARLSTATAVQMKIINKRAVSISIPKMHCAVVMMHAPPTLLSPPLSVLVETRIMCDGLRAPFDLLLHDFQNDYDIVGYETGWSTVRTTRQRRLRFDWTRTTTISRPSGSATRTSRAA